MRSKGLAQVACLPLFLGAAFGLSGCHKGPSPATSRLSVKHGLDPDVSKIDLTPKLATIDDLLAARMPENVQGNLEDFQDHRVAPFETTTFKVDATIKSVQIKPDGDFYMELEGASGKEGVVEIPDPNLCKGSPLEPKIAAARKVVENKYHPTTEKKVVDDPAQIEGVGFLGWRGRATSGGRLMPGLGVDFMSQPAHANSPSAAHK